MFIGFIYSLSIQKCAKSDVPSAIVFYLSLLAAPATIGEHILILKKLFGITEKQNNAFDAENQ